MTRKITTILLALALCLTLLPVGAGAAVDTTTYTLKNDSNNTLLCGDNSVSVTNNVSVNYGNGTDSNPITVNVSGYVLDGGTTGATYTLGADVTIDKPLIIQGTVTLDLCDHVLKYSNGTNKNSVIVVANNAYFVLKDTSNATKNLTYTVNLDTNAWISITDKSNSNSNINVNMGTALDGEETTDGTITLTGGVITGGTGTNVGDDENPKYLGGGVFVGQKATFSMAGGNIVGCTAGSKGGGVYVSKNTTFTMSGGSIVGCTATEASGNGGGVYVIGGTFTMEDGSRIVGCTANGSGGVYVGNFGVFNMKGGNIEGCTASGDNGGGVYVSSTFTMEGGNIKNCTAFNNGGGVYVSDSTFTMVGGNIENCKATENGGGVYVDGTLSASTMDANGGTIKDCTVTGNGAQGSGVYLSGSSSVLKNTSETSKTTFNDDITNDGGKVSANALTKPADKNGKAFFGWFVKNTTGKGYTEVKFDNDSKTTSTSGTFCAFWEGDFEVYATSYANSSTSGYYETFAEAWNSSTGVSGEDCEFKFLQGVNVGTDSDNTLSLDKKATFDLNGNTVSGNISFEGANLEPSGSTLIVKGGGTLSGTVKASAGYATLRVRGGTVNNVEVGNGGTVDCSGGTITTATVNTGGTLECNSGTIKNLTVTGGTVNHTGGTATCTKQAECSVCGTSYGDLLPHSGGTATCTEKAKCDVCHQPYGEKDTNNHVNDCKSGWTVKSTTQHKKVYNLCGTVDVELQSHNWKDGECKDCGYICAHSGNSPTCTESSTCTICGKTFAAKGHSGTGYGYDSSKHWVSCAVCGKPFNEAAHDFSSGNTCVCGYVKQTSHRTYRSSAPTISAVLSHSGAASATDYTSGIYGLTFRSTASFASFRGVQVDGKTIAGTNYIAEEGSIVVYLKAVYLQTLAKGSHTVTILSTEGNTTANFTIGGVQSAKTGDPGVALYALMALTSYTGTALVVRGRKRK